MMIKIYNDAEAEIVADRFFKYYYHDRGKMKWAGFFLSEHTAALRKNQQFVDGVKKRKQLVNYSD